MQAGLTLENQNVHTSYMHYKHTFLPQVVFFKVSEYPFKQNKNMLQNMTILLYANFYNISLNVYTQVKSSQLFSNIYENKNLYIKSIKKIQFSITEINRNKNNCNSSNQK